MRGPGRGPNQPIPGFAEFVGSPVVGAAAARYREEPYSGIYVTFDEYDVEYFRTPPTSTVEVFTMNHAACAGSRGKEHPPARRDNL
ncbi:hypothetical protein AAE478_005397 [Parahypoxylon ruwenzoriense]